MSTAAGVGVRSVQCASAVLVLSHILVLLVRVRGDLHHDLLLVHRPQYDDVIIILLLSVRLALVINLVLLLRRTYNRKDTLTLSLRERVNQSCTHLQVEVSLREMEDQSTTHIQVEVSLRDMEGQNYTHLQVEVSLIEMEDQSSTHLQVEVSLREMEDQSSTYLQVNVFLIEMVDQSSTHLQVEVSLRDGGSKLYSPSGMLMLLQRTYNRKDTLTLSLRERVN